MKKLRVILYGISDFRARMQIEWELDNAHQIIGYMDNETTLNRYEYKKYIAWMI